MKQSNAQVASVASWYSRRHFLASLATAGAGMGLLTPPKAEAVPVDPITAALAVGALKSMAVDVLHGISATCDFLAGKLDSLSYQIYGANFNPISPSGDDFHVQHAFKWAPQAADEQLNYIQADQAGNGLGFARKTLPHFVLGVTTEKSQPVTDVNLSELSFARFMLQKGKSSFARLIPIANRLDFNKLPKDHKEFSVAMIEDRLAREISPAVAKDLKNNYKLTYARKMAAQSGSETFGLCFLHCKSGHQVFWTFGAAQPNEKEKTDLLAQHMEAVLNEPVV